MMNRLTDLAEEGRLNPASLERISQIVKMAEREGAFEIHLIDSADCIWCEEPILDDAYMRVYDNVAREYFLAPIHKECEDEVKKSERKEFLLSDRIESLLERGETIKLGGEFDV